jgi:hypothetical protein
MHTVLYMDESADRSTIDHDLPTLRREIRRMAVAVPPEGRERTFYELGYLEGRRDERRLAKHELGELIKRLEARYLAL